MKDTEIIIDNNKYFVREYHNLNIVLFFKNCDFHTIIDKIGIRVVLDTTSKKGYIHIKPQSYIMFEKITNNKVVISAYKSSEIYERYFHTKKINLTVNLYDDSKHIIINRNKDIQRLLLYLIPIVGHYVSYFEYSKPSRMISYSTGKIYTNYPSFVGATLSLIFYPIEYIIFLIDLLVYIFSKSKHNLSKHTLIAKSHRDFSLDIKSTIKPYYSVHFNYKSMKIDLNSTSIEKVEVASLVKFNVDFYYDKAYNQPIQWPMIVIPDNISVYCKFKK